VKLHIHENSAQLTEAAAAFVGQQAQFCIRQRGVCNLALSGGSTPLALYQHLAQVPLTQEIDWSRLHVFWSDERCVPPDHSESNYHQAHDVLLGHVPVPVGNIHRLKGELAPAEAAAEANRELAAHFGEVANPIFDLILLGLGADGHTASLFPGSEALKTSNQWVVANYVDQVAAWRLSFTYPLINAARNIVFLVSGEKKAAMAKEVIEERNPALPASRVQPVAGELIWFLDAAAAQKLNRQSLSD